MMQISRSVGPFHLRRVIKIHEDILVLEYPIVNDDRNGRLVQPDGFVHSNGPYLVKLGRPLSQNHVLPDVRS